MEETDPFAPKTVFTIKHSEIPKGMTQCEHHQWEKMNDIELYCGVCQSAIIVNSDVIDVLCK